MGIDIGVCNHGIPANNQCDDCNLQMLRRCSDCAEKDARIKKLEKVVNKLSDEAAVYSWIKNYMFLHYSESPFIEYQEGRISLAKLCGLIAKNIRDLIETEIKETI